jgi:hypothetical protein
MHGGRELVREEREVEANDRVSSGIGVNAGRRGIEHSEASRDQVRQSKGKAQQTSAAARNLRGNPAQRRSSEENDGAENHA